MTTDLCYLDQAATSYPKAPGVSAAMLGALDSAASPGRSAHPLSLSASRVLFDAREALADLLDVHDPASVVFTRNVTEALNLAILGTVGAGDLVATSGVEHNSVMRPLRHLESTGLRVDAFRCAPDGRPDLADLDRALARRPRLVVVTHASNVTSAVLPVAEIARRAHAVGALVLVDAAQTAGCLPLSMRESGIDLLAVTGHKGLLGPTGTGALCLADGVHVEPLMRGGTGSDSELEQQPTHLPDALESGTPNVVGLAGLTAAVRHLESVGIEAVRKHELALGARLREGLADLPHVVAHGPADPGDCVGLMSLSVPGLSCSDVGLALEASVGVLTRVGLHCAPAAHRTQGTYPGGTTRVSWGHLTPPAAIDRLLSGLRTMRTTHRRQLRREVA